MSHRTKPLPEVTGIRHFIRELRYHEASRQIFAIVFVAIVSWLGRPLAPLFYAGVPLVALGAAVRMWASGHIMKNRVLATTGPYAYVRHPLYVGNLLVLAGFSLACALWWAAPLALGLVLAYYPPAVEYEDRKLHALFGTEWEAWSARTRALLPSVRPYGGQASGEWSFRQSLTRNGEPVIALFLAACLYALYVRL